MKLTKRSDEVDISSLFGNDSIFSIPFFQRPYKWSPARTSQLNLDILDLVDGKNDVHFLGAIIIHGLPNDPAEPQAYEVIDGQQRLTTLYLYMAAAIRTLIDAGQTEEASNLFRKYMVTSIQSEGRSNLTLHSCREDQGDLNLVIRDLLGAKGFGESLIGFSFLELPHDHPRRGRIHKNYAAAKRFMRTQFTAEGLGRVRSIYSCLLQRISVVLIDVHDPTNGPKIFDSLNSRQEPMTIGDLVRNDVFARVAAIDPEEAFRIDEDCWQPFYLKFRHNDRDYFDSYFFPFGLIHDPNLRKSEVYGALKKSWEGLSPQQVIDRLAKYQNPFLDHVFGTSFCDHSPSVERGFKRLHAAGAPSSVLPFLMRLSHAILENELEDHAAVGILETLDSFLTRRALCGHEPTGLHAVFKRLWEDMGPTKTSEALIRVVSAHRTVVWPSDSQVEEAVLTRPVAASSIAAYVLGELDSMLTRSDENTEAVVELVWPGSYGGDWAGFEKVDSGEAWLIGNALPLSPTQQVPSGDVGYSTKRLIYRTESVFATTREVASEVIDWDREVIRERSASYASACVRRWPHSGE
ncbi:DUF262 domain-containing protein [Pseudarthrobacter cellobiosi]|uniref:DUF262 domain-containing protein n=1 Tax=Pseudarthrobacter cellobiosi TaxID=2953654 RepID=UPI00208FF92B|nr:DUF262 domain-containing protein [Pseudarthrobacter sp. HLT1-5]MCO4253826.1 DUF262 domain-containing protein [Pseudarthrobacter sp. HLT1-5]